MGIRVTAEHLRELLCVARKLRDAARDDEDEDLTVLFGRAAAALEYRAAQLAFHPFDPASRIEPAPRIPVDLLC